MQSEKRNPDTDRENRSTAADTADSLSRRRFIAGSAAGAIGVALAGAALWPLWGFLSPSGSGEEQAKVTIPRANVGVGQAHFFQLRGRPAVVLQVRPGEFIALSAVCTHLGCIVAWRPEEEIFLCPCHAGKFSMTGKVVGGPPPSPLPSFPVAIKDDQLVIG